MTKHLNRFTIHHLKAVCLVLFTLLLGAECTYAGVNWRFHAGAMYAWRCTYKGVTGTNFTWMAGCEIQIPIKNRFFIETGLNFRNGPVTYTISSPGDGYITDDPLKYFDNDGHYKGPELDDPRQYWNYVNHRIFHDTMGFIQLPLRFSYRLNLNEDNEFQFALGPYVETTLRNTSLENNNRISVGLTPAVVFKHKALSLGLLYQNPCIYNENLNRNKNVLMFTVGLNFNGHKIDVDWDAVAAGASALGYALQTTADQMAQATGNSYSSGGYSNAGSTGNSSSRGSGNTYETQYYNWEKRAQECYESLTNLGYSVTSDSGKKSGGTAQSMSASNYTRMKKLLREAQREMRNIRNKAAKEGIKIPQSKWETATVSY